MPGTEVRRRLAELVEDVQNIIGEIRTAIFDLHGGRRHTTQLRRCLQNVVAELTDNAGLRTTVGMSGPLGVEAGLRASPRATTAGPATLGGNDRGMTLVPPTRDQG